MSQQVLEVTEQYKQTYEERKSKVLQLIEQTQSYFADCGQEQTAQSFEALYKNVESGYFSIVVVGEFSAGKSTFLNALMGEKYLPSFQSETTATINFLRHSDQSPNGSGVAIYYTDPNKAPDYTEATLENIEKFVSTRSDMHVVQDVDRVELYVDSKFLRDGVMLVDSPGLNGVAEGHKEVTERQIEKSHACIFMFSAEQPGRKTDFEFLNQLRNKVDSIILVLNKIDVIKNEEQTVEEVVQKLKQNFHQVFPDSTIPEIWPVAAYPALVGRTELPLDYRGKSTRSPEEKALCLQESRMEAFEQRLWRFLTQGEKAKQELLAPVDRMKKLLLQRLHDVRNMLHELSEATDTQAVELEISEIEREIEQIEEKLEAKRHELESDVHQIIKEMREQVKSKAFMLKQKYSRQVNDWTDLTNVQSEIEMFNRKIIQQYMQMVQGVYNQFTDEFETLVKTKFREQLQELDKAFVETDSQVNWELSHSLDPEQFTIQFGLDEYEKKIASYEQELDGLEKQLDEVSMDRLKAQRLLVEKQALESKIDSLHAREENLMAIVGPKPSVVRYQEDREREMEREGVLGKIAQFFVGKKRMMVTETREDRSALREYESTQHSIEQRIEREIQLVHAQMNQLESPEKHPDEYRVLEMQMERLKHKREQEIAAERTRFREQFQRKHEGELRKIRHELEDYLDQLEVDVDREFYRKIRSRKSELTDSVITIIHHNVTQLLNQKRRHLEVRRNQLDTSVEEKEVLIVQYENEQQKVKALLSEVAGMATELELAEVDQIEQAI